MISRRSSLFLMVLAGFMVFEWLMLAKNLGSGPERETAFYVVHYVLVGFNVVLAGVLVSIGWRAWKK